MSTAAGLLEIDSVTVTAPDGSELLHRVSLRADRGHVTVLAGPSGSGKSTLLRAANRLSAPTTGVVRLDGADVASLDPQGLRRRVGIVFQRPAPFPGTVRDNLRVARPDLVDAEATAVLARVGLDVAVLDRVADELSGGEVQRMCLARTLLTGPEVVLMDEPTSALDPDARIGIERLARALADDGLAVVWVSHDLAQVHRLADRTFVLIDGRNATDEEAAAYLGAREGER